jgi:hypothetical protein
MMTNLNTLIPRDSPMFLLEALGNNDLGQIVGYGRLSNGDVEAYVLTPCDEKDGADENCEEGGGENAVLQASPAPRDVPSGTLPPSLLQRMSRYHFPGRAFGPANWDRQTGAEAAHPPLSREPNSPELGSRN